MAVSRTRVYNRTAHRLHEIERIVSDRYGIVPGMDDADITLNQVARCTLQLMWKKAVKNRAGLECEV